MNNSSAIEIGSPAPDLQVMLDSGAEISLGEVYKKGPALVYFYPKADTPGCTKQACNLRDHFSELQDNGIQVFGVSVDPVEDLVAFKNKYQLNFDLVSDPAGKLGEAFGVPQRGNLKYSRQTFLVVEGKVAWLDLKAQPKTQAEDALAALEKLGE